MMSVTLREQTMGLTPGIWMGKPAEMVTTTSRECHPIGGWKAALILRFAKLLAPEHFN